MSESLVEPIEAKQTRGALADVIVRTLAAFPEPVAYPELRRQLPGPYQKDDESLKRTLQELIDQSKVTQFAPYRSKANRYWIHSLQDYAEQVLLSQASGKQLSKAELRNQVKSRLKGLSNKAIEDLISQLVRAGRMYSGSLIRSRAKLFSADPIDARVLLEDALEQIASRCAMAVDEIRALVGQAGSAGESREGSESSESLSTSSEGSPDAELVFQAIGELRPGEMIVPLIELRDYSSFRMSREAFDAAIMQLERAARIDLTLHPDPGSLDDQEREHRKLAGDEKIYDMLIVRR
ncbi:hypothetical protein SH139x_001354 [Planctomycetaceae bacterium SH139]